MSAGKAREDLLAMRREFDMGFAREPSAGREAGEGMLALRAGGRQWALRLSELAGLHAGKLVVPVPGSFPGLLGVASFRGQAAAVYDLGVLLGEPARQGPAPRWMALARGAEPVALAFDGFDGHFEMQPSDLAKAGQDGQGMAKGFDSARRGGAMLAIVDVAALLAGVRGRIGRRADGADGQQGEGDHG